MGGEVLQERKYQVAVCLLLRTTVHLFHAIGSAVIIIDFIVPWNEGIAVYLLLDAAVHHKFYPLVKNRIVIAPRTVDMPELGYHILERIKCLRVPRVLDYGSRYHLGPGIGISFHRRTHQVEMLFAPQRDSEISGHRVRILPQVEVESPLVGFGKYVIIYFQLIRKRRDLSVTGDGKCAFIYAWLRFCRYFYFYPERAGRSGRDREFACGVKTVRDQYTVTLPRASGDGVAHEPCAYA